MPIAIVPGLFVAVLTARREELVEHCRQVLLKSGLEFNRADGARAADIKNKRRQAQNRELRVQIPNEAQSAALWLRPRGSGRIAGVMRIRARQSTNSPLPAFAVMVRPAEKRLWLGTLCCRQWN